MTAAAPVLSPTRDELIAELQHMFPELVGPRTGDRELWHAVFGAWAACARFGPAPTTSALERWLRAWAEVVA